jgi:hypothetical protein
MPALVCIYCRVTWRPGTTPVSHGICPGCLLELDPEAYAEVYGPTPVPQPLASAEPSSRRAARG